MQKQIRILLLEDNPFDAELILRELHAPGIPFTWRRAAERDEYTAALRDFRPDLILSDNALPEFDGLSALKLARKECPDAIFIFVSGTIGEERAVESLRQGATDYVLKDSLTRLAPAIRRALQESEQRLERNRAEQALRAAEAKFRTLVERSLVGIYTIQDQRFVYVNPKFADLFGYEQSEITDMPSIFDLVIDEDRHLFEEKIRSPEGEEIQEFHLAFRGRRKDNSVLHLEMHGAITEYNEKPALIGTLLDFTERFRAEEALRASAEQLRQSQKMEAVGRLAGGIAHDFNNLLTAITGYSEILLDRVGDESPLRMEIEEIKRAGERAAALTRQLLTFSRKQLLQPVVLDLNAVVANVEKMLTRVIGEDIHLITHLAPELGGIKADPLQLEQVILNLAVNARDAMPAGGRITIRTTHADLGPAGMVPAFNAEPGPYVLLTVTDNGTGMDLETQSHIFEPFFTTKDPGKGTGLGLAMVYGILHQCGGQIRVDSMKGRGTSFELWFPRVARSEPEKPSESAPPVLLAGSETILLAEDDDAVRSLISTVLRGLGYTVLESQSGAQALAHCRQHVGSIHMVISDVVMPGVGGYELVRQILSQRPEAKVLFVSGYAEEAILDRGELDYTTELLQKPFTPEMLARRVRGCLEAP